MGGILFDSVGNVAASQQRAGSAWTSERDELFKRRLAEARAFGAASDQLSSQFPELSARWGLSVGQRIVCLTLVAAFGAWLYFSTALAIQVLAVIVAIAFGMIIAIRITAVCAATLRKASATHQHPSTNDLPSLTVLVPLYHEAAVVPALVAAISRLDYPVGRLDVKLLIEADDCETIEAIEAQQLPRHFEVIPIPPGSPRTKPKALNYALALAQGDVVAVFDAEDLPDPGQPRAAMEAFLRGPKNLAVVQAPLQIHNGRHSWISGQFALEYAIHFGVWLPLLAKFNLPLPLGGTSNYFRRDLLVRAGGWDAWNVTEDADIGMRLARFGYAARMIAPATLEEAPVRWRQWRNQRTRWMKGHLQTWLVLNRHPIRAMREMGVGNYLSTHLTLGGGILAALLHGPLYTWVAFNMFVVGNVEVWHWALIVAGYASTLAAAIATRSKHATPWAIMTMPAYWPLQSWAMLRALIEINLKPHFWAKTQHGLSFASDPHLGYNAAQDNVVQLEFPFSVTSDTASRKRAAD